MCKDKLYTTKEAGEQLGWSRKKLAREALLHNIVPFNIDGGNCYTKAMLDELRNDNSRMTGIETMRDEPGFSRKLLSRFAEERKLEYLVLGKSKYYNRQDLCRILESEEYKEQYLLIEKKLKKQAAQRQKAKSGPTLPKQTSEKGYSVDDLARIFNCSVAHIQKTIRDNDIKPICYKKGTHKKLLYSKDVVKSFKQVGFIPNNKNSLYSTAEVLKVLGWSRAQLKKEIVLRGVQPIKQRDAFNYFDDKMLEILQNKEFARVPISTISKEYDINHSFLMDYVKMENIDCVAYHEGLYYKREDLIRVVQSNRFLGQLKLWEKRETGRKEAKLKRELFRDAKNGDVSIDELIDMALSDFNENTPITKQLYKTFMETYTSSGKSDAVEAIRRYSSCGKKFSDLLKKEILEYSDAEVKELLRKSYEVLKGRVYIIESFIFYLLNRTDVKTNFIATYSIVKPKGGKRGKKVYEEDEWFALIDYVCDISLHEELAVNSVIYAQAWVYVMLHTFLGWRKKDMGKLPYPDYEIVNMPFGKEQFDQADAEVLIKSIDWKCSNLVANKTGEVLHFVYPPMYMRLAFGVAISILDWHRRTLNLDYMFSPDFVNNYQERVKATRFFSSFEIKNFAFSSKMANSTLLGTMYGTAIKTKGYAAMAYRLSSFMRSHVSDLNGLNDTTSIYITAGAADKDLDDVSLALFQRGTFGFAYKDLLAILAKGKEESLDFDQTTQAIRGLREIFSPMDVELINGYFLHSMDVKRNVISELLEMTPEGRKNLFDNLARNNCPGKERYVQCIKAGKCPYGTSLSCITCGYAIMTYEMGYKIKLKIYEYCDKIREANNGKNEWLVVKEKSELINLIHLVKEFHNTFKYMGDNYLNVVLPMNEIKRELSLLQSELKRIGD